MARPFTIARTFAAPAGRLFALWTTPAELAQWFGPAGTAVTEATLDLRPGGSYHFCLTLPDASTMWGKWQFLEIVPGERLMWRHAFSDADGTLTRHPLSPTWPLELLTTVEFAERNGATEITLTWEPIEPTEVEEQTFDAAHDSMTGGWTGTFDQLDAYLARKA